MRLLFTLLIVSTLTLSSCHSNIAQKGKIVEAVNKKIATIDHSHRMRIVEDHFVKSDSLFKIRGYYIKDELLKLVGILKTPHFERDDYFYFENGQQLFSGHMMNFKDDKLAEEFKYYFDNGQLARAFMWEDYYVPGQRFPHETFKTFSPSVDSLLSEEKKRLAFFKDLLKKKGTEIQQEKENLGANNE